MPARCGNAPSMPRNVQMKLITAGYLKPTHTNSLTILAGIAPPDIGRAVTCDTERTRQTTDQRHPLIGHIGVTPETTEDFYQMR